MFTVTKEISNGYRCCCYSSWDSDPVGFETLVEALDKNLPVDKLPELFDSDIISVEIKDESGELVAWGKTDWPSGIARSYGYKATRWCGFRPDTGSFEVIKYGGQYIKDKTWDQVVAELKLEWAGSEARRKQEEAERAQKILEGVQKEVHAVASQSRPPKITPLKIRKEIKDEIEAFVRRGEAESQES